MIKDTLSFMLTAVATADKAAFLAKSTETFAKVAEPQFDAISRSIAPHLRSGYKLDHLSDLKRRGGDVAVFKIVFSDATDEAIAMISEKDDKVAGLLLK